MTSTKWIQPLGGDLCAILDKIEANMLQTTTTTKMKPKMDRLKSRILQQKDFSYKCQFRTKVCACISKAVHSNLRRVRFPLKYWNIK